MLKLKTTLLLLILAGCGDVPDVVTQYYLTKSDLRLDVTRVLSCARKVETNKEVSETDGEASRNLEGNFLIVSSTANVEITNSADLDFPQPLDLRELKGTFTDPDVDIDFYSDGRLQGINSIQTGTAKQVLDTVLKTALAVTKQSSDPVSSLKCNTRPSS